MSVDFVGAAVGTAFGELLGLVKEVPLFSEQLKKIKFTLDSIVPIMKDIDKFNRRMDRKDMGQIQALIDDGIDLVKKCLKIKAYDVIKKRKYSKKLTEFDGRLSREFQLSMPLTTARNIAEILEGVEVMGGEVKEVGKDVKEMGVNVNEIRGGVEEIGRDVKELLIFMQSNSGAQQNALEPLSDLAVPEAPDFIVGSEVEASLRKLKGRLLEEGVSVIVVTAPAGCGKTTLVAKLCHDVDIEGKFKDKIMFVPISKKPNLTDIVQKMYQHNRLPVPNIQSEEGAVYCLQQLLNKIGQSPVLLVLDDVWKESESIVDKFVCDDIKDYKIVVTSRYEFPQTKTPRPPGAALPSHSPHNAQVTVKTESLPLKSQWQKGRFIGRGTFGSVYVASNRETGALCAMKEVELLPDDPKSAECMRQLEQEIKVLSRLKHQNIVQYYGSEIVEDRFYIYLEYVHPGSINKFFQDHYGARTESVVCNFTRHILSGLAYLHSQKTIHRDIKGANLLVDASGIVKLADFGMAKHLTGQKIDLSLKGSPYWMAPELLQAKMQKDNSSEHALAVDIWSLGCTIVEMLTGSPPWSEFEWPAAMFKAMKNSPPIPETLSSEGKDFLQCCFRRNPAERPSAAKLLEHPFLKSSQQIDIPPHTRALSRKSTDLSHSPQEHVKHTVDKLSILPTAAQSTAFKAVIDSEGGREPHVETADLTLVSHDSPRYP